MTDTKHIEIKRLHSVARDQEAEITRLRADNAGMQEDLRNLTDEITRLRGLNVIDPDVHMFDRVLIKTLVADNGRLRALNAEMLAALRIVAAQFTTIDNLCNEEACEAVRSAISRAEASAKTDFPPEAFT